MVDELAALKERIEAGMKEQGRYFVSAPAEMAQIGDFQHAVEFARKNGWMLVSHLHDSNYEFWQGVPGDNVV
jgi:hypothetical protein